MFVASDGEGVGCYVIRSASLCLPGPFAWWCAEAWAGLPSLNIWKEGRGDGMEGRASVYVSIESFMSGKINCVVYRLVCLWMRCASTKTHSLLILTVER
jgi:hypothetical protein